MGEIRVHVLRYMQPSFPLRLLVMKAMKRSTEFSGASGCVCCLLSAHSLADLLSGGSGGGWGGMGEWVVGRATDFEGLSSKNSVIIIVTFSDCAETLPSQHPQKQLTVQQMML